jgi:hypothetical protein
LALICQYGMPPSRGALPISSARFVHANTATLGFIFVAARLYEECIFGRVRMAVFAMGGARADFLSAASAFRLPIASVIRVGAQEKMVRVAAGRVVAAVQDTQAFWNCTKSENPRLSVCVNGGVAPKGSHAISLVAFPGPFQAPARSANSSVEGIRCTDRRDLSVGEAHGACAPFVLRHP